MVFMATINNKNEKNLKTEIRARVCLLLGYGHQDSVPYVVHAVTFHDDKCCSPSYRQKTERDDQS